MSADHRSGRPRRIWVTRAQPGAEATAARIRALGLEPVVAPVLEIRARTEVTVDLAGVDALTFTSAAAVSAFAGLCASRNLAVFAVGDATAAAARAAGFADVRSASGDAQALADLIATISPAPRVLNPTAAEPAADLCALLTARGVIARSLVVYETVECGPAASPANLDGVLIHSAKAARAVARLLAGHDHSGLTAYSISQAAGAPLSSLGLLRTAIAAAPNEGALLALLENG
jgi:uroporphyrinogen-III synthase